MCCLGSSPLMSPSRSSQPPLPTSVHSVNNFLRIVLTFVAWAPLPRFPLLDPGGHPSQHRFILLTISQGNCSLVLPGLLSPDFPFQIQAATPPKICSFCTEVLKETAHFCCLGSSPRFPLSDPGSDSSQMPLILIIHLLRKLFTFVAWAPLPRFPLSDPGSDPSLIMFSLFTSL